MHPSMAGRVAIRQALVILVGTSSFALAYNCFSATGFLGHPGYVHEVEEAHIASFLPKVALSQLDSQILAGALLLDARFPNDYKAGHLPGALSLPINSAPAARAAALSGIPRDRTIIVYCENKGCPFSRMMAIVLRNDGYTHLALVDGGYDEWLMAKQAAGSK